MEQNCDLSDSDDGQVPGVTLVVHLHCTLQENKKGTDEFKTSILRATPNEVQNKLVVKIDDIHKVNRDEQAHFTEASYVRATPNEVQNLY